MEKIMENNLPPHIAEMMDKRSLDLTGKDMLQMILFVVGQNSDIAPREASDLMEIEELATIMHRSPRQIVRDLEGGEFKDCARKTGKQWLINRKQLMNPAALETRYAEMYK